MSITTKHLKKHSPDFKLKVVLKYLSEQSTIGQLCSDFNISKATLHKWARQFKANSSSVFNDSNLAKSSTSHNKKTSEKEISNLYAKIGELTVERDFLKKTLDA